MRTLLLILLVAMAAAAFLVPFVGMSPDLERVEIIRADDGVFLQAKDGVMRVKLSEQVLNGVWSSSNPYDFFSELVDPSQIQRLEIVPYGGSTTCNVLTVSGQQVSGSTEFCIALALRKNIPIYVHKSLLKQTEVEAPRSL